MKKFLNIDVIKINEFVFVVVLLDVAALYQVGVVLDRFGFATAHSFLVVGGVD